MKKYLLVSILVIVAFSSCMSPEKKHCIKRIDSLMTYIDSTQFYFTKIDSVKIFKIFEDYKKVADDAATYSVNLKPVDSRWDYLIPFANIEKPLKKALSRYIKFQDEIRFSRNQLKTLRQDFKNDIIDSKKFVEYFQSECEAVNDMFMRIRHFDEDIKYFNTRIDTLNRHIQPILTDLKKTPVAKSNKKLPSQEEDD